MTRVKGIISPATVMMGVVMSAERDMYVVLKCC